MIHITRLNGEEIVLNAGLIEIIESTPDTLISLTTGKKIMVRESAAEVVKKVEEYQQRIGHFVTVVNTSEIPEESAEF